MCYIGHVIKLLFLQQNLHKAHVLVVILKKTGLCNSTIDDCYSDNSKTIVLGRNLALQYP